MKAERGFYKKLSESYSPEQVKLIKQIIQGKLEPDNFDLFPRTHGWVRSCYNEPRQDEKIFRAIDEVMENHGIEGWKGANGEWIEYSNTGDDYALTVIYYRDKLRADCVSTIVDKAW